MSCCNLNTTCDSPTQSCCTLGANNTDKHCCVKGTTWDKDSKKCVSNLPINFIPISIFGAFLPIIGWGIGSIKGFIIGCFLNLILNIVFFWTMVKDLQTHYEIGELLATSIILGGILSMLCLLVLIVVIWVVISQHNHNKIGSIFTIMIGTIITTLGGLSTGSLIFN